jgi:hypothetical protein
MNSEIATALDAKSGDVLQPGQRCPHCGYICIISHHVVLGDDCRQRGSRDWQSYRATYKLGGEIVASRKVSGRGLENAYTCARRAASWEHIEYDELELF